MIMGVAENCLEVIRKGGDPRIMLDQIEKICRGEAQPNAAVEGADPEIKVVRKRKK